jgi:hypothetical protein
MNKHLNSLTLAILIALGSSTPALAQIAGSSTAITSVTESTQLATGWSARKGILGKAVYNEAGEKVGKVQDLIIDPQKNLSFMIIGAGGFVGIGRHDVAIAISALHDRDGRLVIDGASKASLKALPPFVYAGDPLSRERIIASAERDIASARTSLTALQVRAGTASAEMKQKLDTQGEALKKELKTTEDKLAQMKLAGAARWKEFEADLKSSLERLRSDLKSAAA